MSTTTETKTVERLAEDFTRKAGQAHTEWREAEAAHKVAVQRRTEEPASLDTQIAEQRAAVGEIEREWVGFETKGREVMNHIAQVRAAMTLTLTALGEQVNQLRQRIARGSRHSGMNDHA